MCPSCIAPCIHGRRGFMYATVIWIFVHGERQNSICDSAKYPVRRCCMYKHTRWGEMGLNFLREIPLHSRVVCLDYILLACKMLLAAAAVGKINFLVCWIYFPFRRTACITNIGAWKLRALLFEYSMII
jgi:hypothetical protein